MSFDPAFDDRWENVIKLGIQNAKSWGKRLKPVRVDERKISNAIMTEILQGVAQCRLVLADITTIGHIDKRPQRNSNVLYELSLAQAVRVPEDVIVLKSDSDPMPFDVQGIRVHQYDPDNAPTEASALVTELVVDALRSSSLTRNAVVTRALARLDVAGLEMLACAAKNGKLPPLP
ncbi:MAG: hypothetical protein ACYTFO_02160 [Planctomycetota bacterium]|jgi:hypothetical protein